MRIFFANGSINYPPTIGADIHRYQMVRNWKRLGHEVRTLQPDANPEAEVRPRSPIAAIGCMRWADVVFVRLVEQPNGATRLTYGPKRWLIPRRTAVVWELHVSLEGIMSKSGRTPESIKADLAELRESAKRADAVRCVTPGLVEQAHDLLGIEDAELIPNASDPEMFRPDLERPDDLDASPARLHVCNIASGENVYHDMELLEQLADRIDREQLPITIHVIGQSRKLLSGRQFKCLSVEGTKSYLRLPYYLAAMDVGLTLYNIPVEHNSPLKLFDYLASGCVPICSPGRGNASILDGHDAGLVEQWNIDTLTAALLELHEDRAKLARMSANARALVEHEYNWPRIAERTAALCERAIAKRRGG